MPSPVVDQRGPVLADVAAQRRAELDEARRLSLEPGPVQEADGAGGDRGDGAEDRVRLLVAAVPQQMPQALHLRLRAGDGKRTARPQDVKTPHSLLDVAHPHREVKPVEDVRDWRLRRRAD